MNINSSSREERDAEKIQLTRVKVIEHKLPIAKRNSFKLDESLE